MATVSKSGSSRRKGEAPGKIKILMNGSSGKVVHSDSEDENADADIPEDLPEGTVIVEPQPVEDAPSKKKKEIPGRIDSSALDNVNCTACGRQLNPYKNSALQKHPELKVVICKKCEKFLSSGEILKDKDGIDEQCRWCGEGGRLVVCDDCSSAFCKACVMRNFNRSEFNNINDQDSWKCYLCDKSQLQGLREHYRKIRDTLKAIQAKQRAKEQSNGAKDKVSVGPSLPSGSNGRKAAEPCSSSEARPIKKSGPHSVADANGAINDSDLALTVGDLAVDYMYVDIIMDKLSTSTNTFKEMLRALRSQFHSTSPRGADESPPMFQFSLSASLDTKTKKQRCAKALNKGLITYLKSLKTILHKGYDLDDSEASSRQKETQNVVPVTNKERSEKSDLSSREETSHQNFTRRQKQEKEKSERVVEGDCNEKSKSDKKTTSPEASKLYEAKKDKGNKGNDRDAASGSKAKSTPEKGGKVQSKNIDKSDLEKRGKSKDKVVSNNTSQEENSYNSDFNIDDEENVAAKLDLIQELAEEMLKDNASGDDHVSEKEMQSEGEDNNASGIEETVDQCEDEEEKGKHKRKIKVKNIPAKRKKIEHDDIEKDLLSNKDKSNAHEDCSNDEGEKTLQSDVAESKVGEEPATSSSDPLSSDEEETELPSNRKKKKKADSKSEESSTKTSKARTTTKAKSERVKEKKGGKLQLSNNMFSAPSKTNEKKKEENKKEEKKKEEEKKEEKIEKKEKSSLDKEIDKFSKLPTIQKRKRPAENEEETNVVKESKKETKTGRKSKPGPKSSKKGTDLDELSSDPEDKAEDDNFDSNEEDDIEPKVTFFMEQPEEGKEEGITDENEIAKMGLLEESDDDEKSDLEDGQSNDSNSELSDDDSKKADKKPKDEGGKDSEEKDDQDNSDENDDDEEDSDCEDNIGLKSKRIRNKLLDTKLSDSDSDREKESGSKKTKKDEDRSKDKSSGSSLDSDSSDNDEDSEEEDDESEEDEEKKKKKKGKKKKRGKRKGKKKKGSDDEEDEEVTKKGKGKKRKRIKKMSDSSDNDDDKEDKSDDDDDDDDANSSKAGKRKKIRKVMSNKKLEDSTRAAAKAEEKRRKRIASKQREFNVETITDENNPMNCPITTKLILEPGKEEDDEPVIQINKKLIRKLKPHQVEAVQFMWDCLFESVKRSKKESGAGCILAHCMGLGKTLSVISFVHTVLSHEKALKMRTCLVVSPLNTVLNWKNEWSLWLDKKDQLEVWELAGCKQNAARADALKEWQESGGIMIMGYEMYRNLTLSARIKNKRQKKTFLETLVDPGPDIAICDEGHILKNETSAISKAMNLMKTRRRVVLTGTPLQNNLNEYHCMLSYVKPNLLGTRKEFNNRFISPIQNGQCTDSTPRDVKIMKARAHVLHEMLAGCVQRRDYSALTKFLPPKQEYVISVRMTDVQIELYEKYLELTGQGVDGVFNNKGARLFKDYQNLMKIWTHPWVLKLAEIRDEMKMKFDDEDSFIDDESEEERSYSSSESDSDNGKKFNSDSGGEGMNLGPHSKRGTRRTRAKARRQAGEDSDPEEVIAEWKSKSRDGEDDPKLPSEPVDKTISNEWWAQFVCEDDKQKMELGNKLFLLFEILRMCEEIGDKVLIFSQSILTLNIIENFLETVDSKFQSEMDKKEEDEETKEEETFGKSWTKNLDYYRMDGSTSAQNRQLWAQNFNDMENYRTRLFLISTKAGGLGINLVAANRVIIFDASWNPSHDVQSIFRVYRFGQIKPCYIYRFLAQGTMEEKIYERQVTKLSLSQRVVDEHQIERHFSANDLKELYNFRAERWDEEAEKITLALPKDPLLAEVLKTHRKCVVSFHEHDSLLENQIEQTLTEEEKKAAWEEYENEKKGIIFRGPGMDSMNRTASWPMMAAAQILSREQITATVQALRQQLPDLPEEMFHLHVQQALRRQVQMKQDEMRRMEMMRMQEMNYINMMAQGGHNMQNLAPWMQMQRLRAMQNQYMQHQNLGGAYSMAGMDGALGNNAEEPIDLDETTTK